MSLNNLDSSISAVHLKNYSTLAGNDSNYFPFDIFLLNFAIKAKSSLLILEFTTSN